MAHGTNRELTDRTDYLYLTPSVFGRLLRAENYGEQEETLPRARVQVRSLEEIAATLDPDGCLEHMPFMPEMTSLCGRQFVVRHRLTKTCVEATEAAARRTVTLEGAYCDGTAHDGCQRRCPLFWKDVWLKPAEPDSGAIAAGPAGRSVTGTSLRTKSNDGRFFCQSTELGRATKYLFRSASSDARQSSRPAT